MKGVILAGGNGERLMPLTKVTNKHLLPVYNKPMIYYPLQTLINAGITDILIVSGSENSGHFVNLLGSGRDFGINLRYAIQTHAGGIAQALGIAESFVGDDSVCAILGDNIFEDELDIKKFDKGARIFLKEVNDASRFGVANIDKNGNVLDIEEKPLKPKSNFAVTGVYIYDNEVFEIIKGLKPSARGELEITDVNNFYIKEGKMVAMILKRFWSDAGTFESLFKASEYIRAKMNYP